MTATEEERLAAITKAIADADAMLEATQDDYVKALQAKWSEFQARLEADIYKIHSQLFAGQEPSYADFVKFGADKQIEGAIYSELQRLHQSVDDGRVDYLVDQYKDAYNTTAWALDNAIPETDITYNLPPELQIRQFVTDDWDNMFVTRNMKEYYFLANDLKTEIARAMIQGESVSELRDRIIGIIGTEDDGYRYRAERIARTELLGAANRARTHIYNHNSDVIEDVVWITGALGDGRLCDDCLERAGKTRSEVEDIAVEQELGVEPPIHPNCRCTWAPKLKSFKDILPEELANGIEDFPDPSNLKNPIMQYSDWADDNLATADRGNL